MKGFLQEYGVIMVVVAVVLGMLAFGKTGYAKSIQNAILGSTNHIVETGENITKKDKITASDTIDIEGTKYIVLEERENNQALVMTASIIGKKAFQSDYDKSTYLRPDGENVRRYEGSEIDNYLENEWYKSLSSTMKTAIQPTNIKQFQLLSSNAVKEHESQFGNTISRHVFLPGASEIAKVVDIMHRDKVKAFLNDTGIWTRDCFWGSPYGVEVLSGYGNPLDYDIPKYASGIRPTFVIDLSQVDYKVVGHTDYK